MIGQRELGRLALGQLYQEGTTAYTLTADTGTFALTGNDVVITYTPVVDYTMTAGVGAFALTGNPASLTLHQAIVQGVGSWNYYRWPVGVVRDEEEAVIMLMMELINDY